MITLQIRNIFVIETLSMWGVRILFTFLCVKVWGLDLRAVWFCMIADNILKAVALLISWLWNRQKMHQGLTAADAI